MERSHDGAYDVQFQRQSFKEKAARFDEMLTKLRPNDEFDEMFKALIRERESIMAWLMKRKSGCLRFGKFKGIKSWKKEIKREEKELESMWEAMLQCREIEQSFREALGKLTF